MRISPSHATYLGLFLSPFLFPCLAPVLYLSEGGLMPTSTHLPTLLPAANESEPGWREDVASHYELLMRSIRERPWPRPPAISHCSLYLLHAETRTVHIQACRRTLLANAYIYKLNLAVLTPPGVSYSHSSRYNTKQRILMS